MKNIAIFASGNGAKTEAIIEYFKGHPSIKVAMVLADNPEAGVIKVAHDNKIVSAIVTPKALTDESVMIKLLNASNIEMIALSEFLSDLPDFLVRKFPKRIINIHPALLPKYRGKEMHGMKAHEAVLIEKETESGITIHYTGEPLGKEEIIMQKRIRVETSDTPETLSKKIHQLEHEWYPKAIEEVLS